MNKTSLIMLAVFAVFVALIGMTSNISHKNRLTARNYADYTVAGFTQSDIVVFTTSWCPSCKNVLRVLDRNNINYVELDIESDSMIYSEYKRLGGKYIPFIIHNGRVINFRREDRLLAELGYAS